MDLEIWLTRDLCESEAGDRTQRIRRKEQRVESVKQHGDGKVPRLLNLVRCETHQCKSNKKEREEIMIKREDYQLPPKEGFVLTHFLTVADVKRSAEFYLRVLGGTVVRSGEPTIIHIANSWLILNVGGGPTDDKPNVTLRPPQNPNEVSSFLNIRVADIRASYEEWRRRGAEFLTEPKDHGVEIRCYMRDPDGYIIEVGQTTGPQA
jgi:predicted enzyme related to lactoylglutathione lyase